MIGRGWQRVYIEGRGCPWYVRGEFLGGTPAAVILRWNVEGTTTLIKLPNIVCGAQLDKNPTTIFDETNFRACALDRARRLGTGKTNSFGTCVKTIHLDGARTTKVRMTHMDPGGTYVTLCAALPGTV